MADHVDITLWIDRRWKDAIEKHLKGETLQEHLENVLDELCNQLPEQEYERISCAIQSEAAAQRAKKEAARTYAAYHVTERGQEWYFKTSPGEELLVACKKLRGYVAGSLWAMAPFSRPMKVRFPTLPLPSNSKNRFLCFLLSLSSGVRMSASRRSLTV